VFLTGGQVSVGKMGKRAVSGWVGREIMDCFSLNLALIGMICRGN